jgi:hypothetical protein
MSPLRWLIRWWHARQRQIDLDILWPVCCAEARDLDHAKMAFAVHAFNDTAWTSLGDDKLYAVIDQLEPP